MVCGWGYFLIQGVRDPLGGINSLWPLFGIANQMLAAIALCLATTVLLKMQLAAPVRAENPLPPRGRPGLALITLVPLIWLVAVTFTAGVEKIWSSDPRIGFLTQAHLLDAKVAVLTQQRAAATGPAADALAVDLAKQQTLAFNNRLDAGVAGAFLALVGVIIGLSVWAWAGLLSGRTVAKLQETEPVWLADYELKEAGPNLRTVAGAVTLTLGLAKELSGETHYERARQQVCACEQHSDQQIYVQATEARFNGVRRCC